MFITRICQGERRANAETTWRRVSRRRGARVEFGIRNFEFRISNFEFFGAGRLSGSIEAWCPRLGAMTDGRTETRSALLDGGYENGQTNRSYWSAGRCVEGFVARAARRREMVARSRAPARGASWAAAEARRAAGTSAQRDADLGGTISRARPRKRSFRIAPPVGL